MKHPISTLYPTLLNAVSKQPPDREALKHRSESFAPVVVDDASFRAIEIDALFDAINHTSTQIGSASLFRSLKHPLSDVDLIEEKQTAIREIEANPRLRQQLERLLETSGRREQDFYNLLFGTFLGAIGSPAHPYEFEGFGYEQYLRGTGFLENLVDHAVGLEVDSGYLGALKEDICKLSGSRAYRLIKGPAYRTEKGMITAEEKPWFIPALKFTPSLFKPVAILATVIGMFLFLEFAPFALDLVASLSPALWFLAFPLALLYFPVVGNFDRDGCIYPLRELLKKTVEVQEAVEALGQLDELMSAIGFKEAFVHPCTLPRMIEDTQHKIRLDGVRNPIIGKSNPDYVANDLELIKNHLLMITGPNSGGKTAFCKTLTQTQLLAQMGYYVPATSAEMTAADRIFYQVPELSQLADGEGRFGTELKRTKEMFLASSARSLVVMDELSEGTTHQEKIEISMDVLEGFAKKGNNTILITHNHELVEALLKKGMGLARQVEFSDEIPTFRMVPGISTVSHASRVAKKIGFSKEDIERHLNTTA
jgi:hypothetical protein